jgi:geranylgeranyl diphosphate synthase, type II
VDVRAYLAAEAAIVERGLDHVLPAAMAWPARLHEAMRYAVFGGGKRVRPILARAACRAAGGDPDEILAAACALELIHTYSLIHDDLPALDNDTLRRGRPTVHVAFDEPLAILAGDALLTEGFVVLARYPEGEAFASRRADACRAVAEAVSSRGMVGGQVEDLEATGKPLDAERLERIHRAKTGALLRVSVELGAILAGVVDATLRQAFARFGAGLGLLFQIADDILDVTGTASTLGKSPGKDAAAGKLTYPAVFGLDAARSELQRLARVLDAQACELEGREGALAALVDYVARRDR